MNKVTVRACGTCHLPMVRNPYGRLVCPTCEIREIKTYPRLERAIEKWAPLVGIGALATLALVLFYLVEWIAG